MKNHKLFAIILLLSLACSCGKSQEVASEKELVSKIINLPAMGIVNDLKSETFSLVTLPEKLGDQPGQTVVDFSKANVVDAKGEKADLITNSTVNVEGSYDDKVIYAKKVTVVSIPNTNGTSLALLKKQYLRTADLLKKLLGNKIPENFGDGWELENHGSLKDKTSSRAFQYKKDDWQIVLVDDPMTVDRYEITVYGPNKFLWTGKQTTSDLIVETK